MNDNMETELTMEEAVATALYRIYGRGERKYAVRGEDQGKDSPYPWLPHTDEVCEICKNNIRLLTHPNDLKKHCSTYAHIASMFGVDPKVLRNITKEREDSLLVMDALVNDEKVKGGNSPLDKLTFQLTAAQTHEVKKLAARHKTQASKIIHSILNDALGIGLPPGNFNRANNENEGSRKE
jgi:hypothetical protein